MATATRPTAPFNREESQRNLRHPLERLRGYIRFYVSAEGLAVLLLYLALWFWIGLALDYGSFRLFRWDWVQRLPWSFRAVLLGGLIAGLLAVVATRVLLRLFREFQHTALALVLERRFPSQLGDRLITAVELADPRIAHRYGFSQAMIDQTIRDAATRVDETHVHEAFNWRRLVRYGLWAMGLSAGIYVLVGLACGTAHIVRNRPLADETPAIQVSDTAPTAPVQHSNGRHHSATDLNGDWADMGEGFSDVNDVAALWFERNILLWNTIWPRRAQLELINFPGDEKKIGRNSPPLEMRVRALKWLVPDSNRQRAPEGWRSMLWTDLDPKLLGVEIPKLPRDWKPRDAQRGMTVDEVELRLAKPEIKNVLPPDLVIALERIYGRLDELSAERGRRRRVRQLEVPNQVTLILWGATQSIEQGLPLRSGNEYAGTLPELKESVRFEVRAEDYSTPVKRITVVPPPEMVELKMDTAQPAYLYQRPWRGAQAIALKGLKQQFHDVGISLTGDKSVVEVPAGTNLVVRAATDKSLAPNGVRFIKREGTWPVPSTIEQQDDHNFQTRFDHVTAPLDLTFEFTDTDGVHNERQVIIKPLPDLPPEVDVQLDVLRRMPDGSYLCTTTAQVPFKGKIRDDHGLSEVEYVYTVAQASSDSEKRVRAAAVAMAAGADAGLGLPRVYDLWRLVSTIHKKKLTPNHLRMTAFDQAFKEAEGRALDKDKFFALLKPLPENASKEDQEYMEQDAVDRRLIKEVGLDDAGEFFDVGRLGLKVRDPNAVQPHYYVDLNVVGADNDIETGPHHSQNKERYRLLVVSEEDLVAEIAVEENELHRKLSEKLEQLRDARSKLDTIAREMPGLKPDQFTPMVRRTEEVDEAISRANIVCQEIFTDYRRIGRELDVNRDRQTQGGLVEKMMNKVQDHIVKPLDHALNFDFVQTDESVRGLGKVLEARQADMAKANQAQQDLQRLIDSLEDVLRNMQQVLDVSELVQSLQKIKKGEDDEKKRFERLLKEKRDIFD